jgi:hypothetical protein
LHPQSANRGTPAGSYLSPARSCSDNRSQLFTEANVPLNMMQKWLGHARIETTAIYVNALGSEERAIAARMWRN